MDFIFMLTKDDKTVENCLDVFDKIKDIGVRHIGFKDVGVAPATLKTLAERIKAAGATAYMEVVSVTVESARHSIRTAIEIGVDRVLGGQDIEFALPALAASGTGYYPFAGRPTGHPTALGGSSADIAEDCRRMRAAGCPGVDLLAYRATEADPLDLVRAARSALDGGYLIAAGSVSSPARVAELGAAGVDGFTIGTAILDGSFAPGDASVAAQCRAALAACEVAGTA